MVRNSGPFGSAEISDYCGEPGALATVRYLINTHYHGDHTGGNGDIFSMGRLDLVVERGELAVRYDDAVGADSDRERQGLAKTITELRRLVEG
jgi:glyoxylase-like metal-dependent hydrolase (beta-lactamase superfamily II)